MRLLLCLLCALVLSRRCSAQGAVAVEEVDKIAGGRPGDWPAVVALAGLLTVRGRESFMEHSITWGRGVLCQLGRSRGAS